MFKTLNTLYKERISKAWTEEARRASAESRSKDIDRASNKIIGRVSRWSGVKQFTPNYISNEIAHHVAQNPHLKGYEKDIYESIKTKMGS